MSAGSPGGAMRVPPFKQLRSDAVPLPPVRYDAELDTWIVTGWKEVRQVLRDDRAFSTEAYRDFRPDLSRIQDFICAPAADHRRLRSILARLLSHERIARIARSVLAPCASELAAALPLSTPIDAVNRYIRPYQEHAVAEITGVRAEDAAEVIACLRVADDAFRTGGPDSSSGLAALRLLREALHGACVRGGSTSASAVDLLSGARRQRSAPVSIDEMGVLVLPFFETLALRAARDLPATLLQRVAFSSPSQQRWMQEEPLRLFAAAEEAVRMQEGAFAPRRTRDDVRLGGICMPRGARVLALLGDSNKDPRRYRCPHEFDPMRPSVRGHNGFGAGRHACVGRSLALAMAVEPARASLRRNAILRVVRRGTDEWRLFLEPSDSAMPPVADAGKHSCAR